MQTPIEIEFRGMDPIEHVRSAIAQHVADLESRFGRLTACRVLVKSPGGHHRNSGIYEVNIHLSLPNGREIAIGRTAAADERLADLAFAVNHAFKRARRRLQDQVRRMQGHVKVHADPQAGADSVSIKRAFH
jgi:ribosome-associated translation inhibitor RaiA